MKEIIDNLICCYENSISDRICDNIINNFESENQENIIFNKLFNTESLKMNPNRENWRQLDTKISDAISKLIPDYISIARETIKIFPYNSFKDNGYNICKFNKNIGYNNAHTNFNWNDKLGVTILSVLIFINTIDDGGEVKFSNGKIIKPKKGNMIIFPSCWDILWKNNVPISDDNYIITTTLFYKHI
jgi:hypothetical protein